MRWHSRTMLNQNRVTAAASEPGSMTEETWTTNTRAATPPACHTSHFSQIPPLNVGSRNPNKSHAFHILPSKCRKQFQAANFLSSVCLGKWLVDFADWTRLQMFQWIYYKYACHFCATLSAEVIIQMPSELGTRKGSTTPCPQQSKIKQANKK